MTDLTLDEAAEFTRCNALFNRWGGSAAYLTTFPTGEARCVARIGNRGLNQCKQHAKVTLADGSTWCGVHSPQAKKNRNAAVVKRQQQEYARRNAIRDHANKREAERANRDRVFGDLLDALIAALPFLEDAEKDPAYKPGVAAKVTAKARAAIQLADPEAGA